ncbi:ABC transporter ATP-binding protein [Lactococcus carnosus]|uniref:ABC transporter ATP-binding protein n=1 Tax=Pseudolactococcus carnosus TaxID=2749961 RepID=UPI001C4F9D93|nr:ABC transporter ATP-binding protein [Lactococcus carnosus]MCJ1970630.1 ABC transporter ATP-binding protein [Lactococcus carnosus]MCJ1979479.1 ABC transporter ATP-binding protein [Lactococcus carnosus]MCJ1999912.1 ABC transporter ATP-binding protein [Lactococcus carnosus]
MIELRHVTKAFNGRMAVDDISFTISEGQIFGFLGPSGSGKSTTINILTGQLTQDSGQAWVLGKDSRQIGSDDLLDIGIMSDTIGFYERLSIYKNLLFFAKFHHVSTDYLDQLLRRLDLFDDKNKKAIDLSTGMKQRLLLIQAVLHTPKLLFLDEPTSGLDPTLSREVHRLLLELKNKGVTIFLTTHDMTEATEICDEIALLYQGKIIEAGAPQAVIDKYSDKGKVVIRFENGKSITVPQEETANYLAQHISSIHTSEATLASIFIQLTGEKFEND